MRLLIGIFLLLLLVSGPEAQWTVPPSGGARTGPEGYRADAVLSDPTYALAITGWGISAGFGGYRLGLSGSEGLFSLAGVTPLLRFGRAELGFSQLSTQLFNRQVFALGAQSPAWDLTDTRLIGGLSFRLTGLTWKTGSFTADAVGDPATQSLLSTDPSRLSVQPVVRLESNVWSLALAADVPLTGSLETFQGDYPYRKAFSGKLDVRVFDSWTGWIVAETRQLEPSGRFAYDGLVGLTAQIPGTGLEIRGEVGPHRFGMGLSLRAGPASAWRADWQGVVPYANGTGRLATDQWFALTWLPEPHADDCPWRIVDAIEVREVAPGDTIRVLMRCLREDLNVDPPVPQWTVPEFASSIFIESPTKTTRDTADYWIRLAVLAPGEGDLSFRLRGTECDEQTVRLASVDRNLRYPAPVPWLRFDPATFVVDRVEVSSEEEAPVPAIFFAPGATSPEGLAGFDIPALVAKLRANPDIRLQLRASGDPSSDGYLQPRAADSTTGRSTSLLDTTSGRQLLVSRAESLLVHLTEGDRVDLRPRITVTSVVDEDLRTPDPLSVGAQLLPADLADLTAENRRVTLIAKPDSALDTVTFHSGESDSIWLGKWAAIRDAITRNPDLDLVAFAEADSNASESVLTGRYRDLLAARERIRALSGLDPARIRLLLIPGTRDEVTLRLSADGLLLEPRMQPLRWIENGTERRLRIAINRAELAEIREVELAAVDSSLHPVRVLAAGDPSGWPDSLAWDLSDSLGSPLPPQGSYLLRLRGNRQGTPFMVYSTPLNLRIQERQVVSESKVIIGFPFNRVQTHLPYLESRLELLASQVLAASTLGPVSLAMEGLTDPIGTAENNRFLSTRRAERELTRLRAFLRARLDLPDAAALDRELARRAITLSAVGLGESGPADAYRPNARPEGRSANRQVRATLRYERVPGGEKP